METEDMFSLTEQMCMALSAKGGLLDIHFNWKIRAMCVIETVRFVHEAETMSCHKLNTEIIGLERG